MIDQRTLTRIVVNKHTGLEKTLMPRCVSLIFGIGFILILAGCAGSALSSLSPEEIEPPLRIPASLLPKGDVYADEEGFRSDMTIAPGDSLEIGIHAGEKRETYTAVVREDGTVVAPLIDTAVSGLTVNQAKSRIQEDSLRFYRNPIVQVRFKKKKVRVKRVIVVGEVNKPGVIPMTRNMNILSSIVEAGSYTEGALLEEIRIIRSQDEASTVLMADVSRLLTYGDWSRNIALKENDIVFVPQTSWGRAEELVKRTVPLGQLMTAPFVGISDFKILTQ